MCDMKICRICLNKDAKLFQLENFNLKHYYEQVMQSQVVKYVDELPRWFCVECAALLHKYHKFREKCIFGQETLNNLLCKGFMNYKVVEDVRRNREDLHALNYIITNKHIKTYHVKHKKEAKHTQIENVIIDELNEIKDEIDDDISLDKISKNLKIEATAHENYNDFDNDDFLDSLEMDKDSMYDTNEKLMNYQTNDIKNDLAILDNKLLDDSKDSLLFSLLNKKKKNEKVKPLKFEKKKRARINKDNWDVKILSEDEALEQFRERMNNSRYIKFHYKCEKCLKGFSKKDILLRHNKQCHDQGSFECRFCHMLFKRKFQLGRHMVVHYYVYQCLRCDLKCNLLSTAAFHEDSHNGVLRTCKHCGEQFKHVSTYYTHLRMSHRNSHVCKLCGASFVSEIGLEFHMKRQHCIEETALCGASFVSEIGLEFHMKRQHCIEETADTANANIYCEKCDVSFASQVAFDEHLAQSNLHEAEQPARRKKSRKEILENATTCRYCKIKFITRAECRKHVSAEHRGEKVNDNKTQQERVMCEICGAWLAAASIEVHMNRHTKKKVFPCQYCGKEFLCKSGYNTHQAKHTGVRPHACKICHKRFSQKFAMEIHYRRVHLKEPYPKRNRKKNSDEVPLFEKMKWN